MIYVTLHDFSSMGRVSQRLVLGDRDDDDDDDDDDRNNHNNMQQQ